MTPNFLHKFSRLKIDRSRGAAPHKPLLLLCLLELAEEGKLSLEIAPITGELAFRFASFWSVVAHRRPQKPDLKLPLFHMRSDGFWQPLDEQLQILKYRDLPACIRFDAGFLAAVNDPARRAQARAILIRTYFAPDEQAALWALLGRTPPPVDGPAAAPPADPEAVERGREGRFRIGVVTAYDYTCALTGYRLVTRTSGTIVDAAHIHQFARSRNNDLNNGIALCKNATGSSTTVSGPWLTTIPCSSPTDTLPRPATRQCSSPACAATGSLSPPTPGTGRQHSIWPGTALTGSWVYSFPSASVSA